MEKQIKEIRRIGAELTERGHESLSNELEVALQRLERRIEKSARLFNMTKSFIKQRQISCGESVFQVDSNVIAAPDFLHDACEIVGYYGHKD